MANLGKFLAPAIMFFLILGCGQGQTKDLTPAENPQPAEPSAPQAATAVALPSGNIGQQSGPNTTGLGTTGQLGQPNTNPMGLQSTGVLGQLQSQQPQVPPNPLGAPMVPQAVQVAPSQPANTQPQVAMINVQVGQEYSGGSRVNFPEVGASFQIPANWSGTLPQGSQSFMMSSSQEVAIITALSHQATQANQLIPALTGQIPIAPALFMQVQGQAQAMGANVVASVSVSDGAQTLPGYLIAVFRPQGGGVIFVGFGPNAPETYQQRTSEVAASFIATEISTAQTQNSAQLNAQPSQPQYGVTGQPQAGAAPAQGQANLSPLAQEWDAYLRGKKVSYRDRYSSNTYGGGGYITTIDYYLCRDGRFTMNDGSSLSSGDADSYSFSNGGDVGGNSQGQWEIVTEGNLAGIKLTYSNGQVDLARLDYVDGQTLVNGERWYVTEENPYC